MSFLDTVSKFVGLKMEEEPQPTGRVAHPYIQQAINNLIEHGYIDKPIDLSDEELDMLEQNISKYNHTVDKITRIMIGFYVKLQPDIKKALDTLEAPYHVYRDDRLSNVENNLKENKITLNEAHDKIFEIITNPKENQNNALDEKSRVSVAIQINKLSSELIKTAEVISKKYATDLSIVLDTHKEDELNKSDNIPISNEIADEIFNKFIYDMHEEVEARILERFRSREGVLNLAKENAVLQNNILEIISCLSPQVTVITNGLGEKVVDFTKSRYFKPSEILLGTIHAKAALCGLQSKIDSQKKTVQRLEQEKTEDNLMIGELNDQIDYLKGQLNYIVPQNIERFVLYNPQRCTYIKNKYKTKSLGYATKFATKEEALSYKQQLELICKRRKKAGAKYVKNLQLYVVKEIVIKAV